MERRNAKLTPQNAPWLNDPGVQAVCDAITAGGFEVFFVGGCVRNALMQVAASDLDLSTNARPEQVQELAASAGLRTVPTGIEHGTITVIANSEGYEVTTFRKDVETDGRRAVVAFADRIEDDARRRDFTMNALYANPDGQIIDPVGGLPDLFARRLRFIDDAAQRIREDYLRVLRFFRFHAWYCDPAEGFDQDAISAIAANTDGLATLSAERIGAELQKLLSASSPSFALAGMQTTGVLPALLPGAEVKLIGPLVHIEAELSVTLDWRSRLVALGGENVSKRLRLSKADARFIETTKSHIQNMTPFHKIAYKDGREIALSVLLNRSTLSEEMPETALLESISKASNQVFPIKSSDLIDAYQGPALGQKLRQLEEIWIASEFELTKADLLNKP